MNEEMVLTNLDKKIRIILSRVAGVCLAQSHYIEVAQGDIFMEQKMWFGQVLGRFCSVEKKSVGPIMSNFWGCFFHVFRCKKNPKIFLKIP